MSVLKIVVTGPACAGKTTFVKSLTDEGLVSTEKQTTDAGERDTTTVGFDYGRVQVAGHHASLFGTPGQARFEYLWDILGEGADGCVFLFPADHSSTADDSIRFVRRLSERENAPVVVGVTRTDLATPEQHPDLRECFAPVARQIEAIDPRDHAQCRRLLTGLVRPLRG
jgi:signal recognition particle receptor subunit beta